MGAPDPELDHPLHEIDEREDWCEPTRDEPTDNRTIQAFVAEVLAVATWDESLCHDVPTEEEAGDE